MYPAEDNQPLHGARPGQMIEHKLMPGFPMSVLDTERCETDPAAGRGETHDQYKIIDPDGNTDWLCAYDVRMAPDSTT
jgi:hypothetical protein